MNEKDEFYGINLDNYIYPKAIRGKSGYIGTKEDFEAFLTALKCYGHSEHSIGDAMVAIQAFLNGDDQDELVKKHGPGFEKVHILNTFRQFETVKLERQSWHHTTCNDSVYPLYADKVHMSMMIVCHNGTFYTAYRGAAEGLHICLQGSGWTEMPGVVRGYPEMVTYDPDEDIFEMRLYSLGDELEPKDLASVINDPETRTEIGLHHFCRDIIAEGPPRTAHPKAR